MKHTDMAFDIYVDFKNKCWYVQPPQYKKKGSTKTGTSVNNNTVIIYIYTENVVDLLLSLVDQFIKLFIKICKIDLL